MVAMHRVRVVGTGWTGSPSLNTFYFLGTSQDAAGVTECAARVRSGLVAMQAALHLDTTWNVQNEVDILESTTGVITDTISATAQAGVSGTSNFAGGIGPSMAMCVLKWTTSTFIAGRRVRGRAFIGPLSGNAFDDGLVTTTARDLVNAGGTAIRTGTPSGPVLVVWHRPVNGAGGLACVVSSNSANVIPGVLRSRRD